MKKVINGKVFDTHTGDLICAHKSNARDRRTYLDEELYLSPGGTYFVYGAGGEHTRYGPSDDEDHWATAIWLPTEEQVREFIERHGTVEDYTVHFGEPEVG